MSYTDPRKAQEHAHQLQREIDQQPKRKHAVIVAVDLHGGFSRNGEIPWHYKEDFAWFKQQTKDQIVVMGRKTYDDINKRMGDKGAKEVLPGRQAFVVTSTELPRQNATAIRSMYDYAMHLDIEDNRTVFFIGGKSIFTQGLSLADTVYVTAINDDHGCDLFFPVEVLDTMFKLSHKKRGDDSGLVFLTYKRVAP